MQKQRNERTGVTHTRENDETYFAHLPSWHTTARNSQTELAVVQPIIAWQGAVMQMYRYTPCSVQYIMLDTVGTLQSLIRLSQVQSGPPVDQSKAQQGIFLVRAGVSQGGTPSILLFAGCVFQSGWAGLDCARPTKTHRPQVSRVGRESTITCTE
jgi:hypothetical protein